MPFVACSHEHCSMIVTDLVPACLSTEKLKVQREDFI